MQSFILGTQTSAPTGLSFKASVAEDLKPAGSLAEGKLRAEQSKKQGTSSQNSGLLIKNYSELPKDPLKPIEQTAYNALILNQESQRLEQSLTALKNLDYERHGLAKPSTIFFVDPNATYDNLRKESKASFANLFNASLSEPLKALELCVAKAGLQLKTIGGNIAKLFAGLFNSNVEPGQNLSSIDIDTNKFTVTHGSNINSEKTNFNNGVYESKLYNRNLDLLSESLKEFTELLPKTWRESQSLKWGELFAPTKEGLFALAKHVVNLLNKYKKDTLLQLENIGVGSTLIQHLKTSMPKIEASEIGTNGDKYGLNQILNPQTENVVFQAIQAVLAKLLGKMIASLEIGKSQFIFRPSQITNILSNPENKKIFLAELAAGSDVQAVNEDPKSMENIYNGAAVMAKAYYEDQAQRQKLREINLPIITHTPQLQAASA